MLQWLKACLSSNPESSPAQTTPKHPPPVAQRELWGSMGQLRVACKHCPAAALPWGGVGSHSGCARLWCCCLQSIYSGGALQLFSLHNAQLRPFALCSQPAAVGWWLPCLGSRGKNRAHGLSRRHRRAECCAGTLEQIFESSMGVWCSLHSPWATLNILCVVNVFLGSLASRKLSEHNR